MGETHFYLSLFPEALIASQLDPEAFGSYLAVGTQFHSSGEAIFFELKPGFDPAGIFPLHLAAERCTAHQDGSPKRSVYLATYRVLERIPSSHFGSLYLSTNDGRVLGLNQAEFTSGPGRGLHLYQEFCPVTTRAASRLAPADFAREITRPENPVSFPRTVFAELILRNLATDPLGADIGDLPYRELTHLRICLHNLLSSGEKNSKTVSRRLSGRVQYRTIRNGFFVADQEALLFYPMPPHSQLEGDLIDWWRSAQTAFS